MTAVTARVQQIQGLVQSLQPTPVRSGLSGLTSLTSLTSLGLSSAGAVRGPATAGGASAAAGTSFEQLLSQARTARTAGTGAGGPVSGAVDADGVPLDLKPYGNGKVPASALQGIGVGNHTLWAPAAQAFTQLRAAAQADGVTIGVTDSYRSYADQVDVAERKGLYKNGGLAAVPGTSDHGWGLSLDLKLDSRAQAWMRTHAGGFGFEENTPREPWHWTFQP
jgi:hypothetical protein